MNEPEEPEGCLQWAFTWICYTIIGAVFMLVVGGVITFLGWVALVIFLKAISDI